MAAKKSFAPLRRTSHFKSGMMAGALGLTALTPIPEANAADLEAYPVFGVYLGYSFGGENPGIAWGLEAYADFSTDSLCGHSS